LDTSLINADVLHDLDQLHAAFESAKPFRHVIVDNFFRADVAEQMLRDFPTVEDPSTLVNEFGAPNPKSAISDVKSLAPIFRQVDRYIQSREFLDAMERITGIPDLRYDPWYYGAGTHENFHGAGLDAHYDFNIHPNTAFHRRLNAIVYLNKDWDPDWKGDIAFHTDPWDLKNDYKKSVQPEFNRCVIFETTENSWHSVTPVDLPAEQRRNSRKSFTIYLYTESRPAEETAPEHGTVYVQGNLPDHIREGRTLTADDMEAIENNLLRRHEYLRNMYKREYRFSQVIEDLKRQIGEWKSTSYLPVLGLAKIKRVATPMYHDGWMAKELRADIELRADMKSVTANVWLPDDQDPIDVEFRFGDVRKRQTISGGVNSIRIDVPYRTAEIRELALSADPVRVAGPHDSREISVIVDSIAFETT
jgi:hypothetical protein